MASRQDTPSTGAQGASLAPDVDALSLLSEDHDEVRSLFEEYEALAEGSADDQSKRELVDEICLQLTLHSMVEEEIFYPAARNALGDAELIDEAEVEHQGVKDLIDELQLMGPSDPQYDDRVRALQESVEHHVQEEEGELFPLVADSSLDLEQLGEQITVRKEDLLTELRGEDGFDMDED